MARAKKIDPYDVLGVDRDATRDEIKSAARRRAKQTHPDAGGAAEDFHAVQTAKIVLLDPAKRRRFDETGEVDEGPDQVDAGAVGLMIDFVNAKCNAFLVSGRPEDDPRRVDLLREFRWQMESQARALRQSVEVGRRSLEFWRDMVGRFTTDQKTNMVARSIEGTIAAGEEKIETIGKQIECRLRAVEIAESYGFRFDELSPAEATFRGVGPDGQPVIMTLRRV